MYCPIVNLKGVDFFVLMVMAVKVVESKITKIGKISTKKEKYLTLPEGIDERV